LSGREADDMGVEARDNAYIPMDPWLEQEVAGHGIDPIFLEG
jgi:hypothetical protein